MILIEHNNKNSPISNSFEYHSTPSFSSFQYTTIHYNFQYIKYESDDGFFFKNSKILNGISFSDMNYNLYYIFRPLIGFHRRLEFRLNTVNN